jgi:putative Mn2+ efflux pump MntP
MILLRVQIILDNFLASISKGQSCGQNVKYKAQRAVALMFLIFSHLKNTRGLKMISPAHGTFSSRFFSP